MLVIHFLDVGRGDCSIIKFPSGRLGVVDINISEGYTNPIAYLNERIKQTDIFRFILTHPHRDHLFGLKDLYNEVSIANFWDIRHNFEPDKSSDHWDAYKPNWNQYQAIQGGNGGSRYLNGFKRDNDERDFLVQDRIRVLSPTPELEKAAMQNTDDDQRVHKACFVLKIEYAGRSVILGGDADKTCWEDIYQHYKSNDMLDFLRADVLKASHHGHESGYHEKAVLAMDPDHVVISESERSDSDFSDVYKVRHGAKIYATWDRKNWVLYIDENGKIEFEPNTKGKQ